MRRRETYRTHNNNNIVTRISASSPCPSFHEPNEKKHATLFGLTRCQYVQSGISIPCPDVHTRKSAHFHASQCHRTPFMQWRRCTHSVQDHVPYRRGTASPRPRADIQYPAVGHCLHWSTTAAVRSVPMSKTQAFTSGTSGCGRITNNVRKYSTAYRSQSVYHGCTACRFRWE